MSKNLFLQALLTKMYGLKQKYEPNCETAENFNLWFFVILNHYFQFFFFWRKFWGRVCVGTRFLDFVTFPISDPKCLEAREAISMQNLSNYNHIHDILRLFDVLPSFPFITSETMHDYYLKTWYIRVASWVDKRLKTYNIRK